MFKRLRWRLGLRVNGWRRREWRAWHNAPCPPVQEVEVNAVHHCVTLDPIEEED